MQEMMKQCCDADGKPDPEKMKQFFGQVKQFMEQFTKKEFADDDLVQMQEFCDQVGMHEMGGRMIQMLQVREAMKSYWSPKEESAPAAES